MAAKCTAFKSGCPFKGCKTVGEFEDKLGQMRDQCKGDIAYLEFLRVTVLTAKEKEAATLDPLDRFSKPRVAAHLPKTPVESLYFLRTTSWYVSFYI